MSRRKRVLVSVLCQMVGMVVGMVLGFGLIGLVALIHKLGLLERFQ